MSRKSVPSGFSRFRSVALMALLLANSRTLARTSEISESSESASVSEDYPIIRDSDNNANRVSKLSGSSSNSNIQEIQPTDHLVKYYQLPNSPKLNAFRQPPLPPPLLPLSSSSSDEDNSSDNAIPRGSSSSRGRKPACLTCASSQHNQRLEATLPEQSLRKVRLEMIKEQILKKLRLKEPPSGEESPQDGIISLPPPVAFGELHLDTGSGGGTPTNAGNSRDFEDFYGKTEQVIVFSEDILPNCGRFGQNAIRGGGDPSACFVFKLPKEIRYEELSSVELWFYKSPNPNDFRLNQTFWSSELLLESSSSSGESHRQKRKVKLMDTKANVRQSEGWISLNVSGTVSKWLRKRNGLGFGDNPEHIVQIGCRHCGLPGDQSPVGTLKDHRPFMVFNIAEIKRKRRTRRQEVNCSQGVTDCCRERFVVNFREIGWHWVIAPESYDAFFCKGSCMSESSLSMSSSRRTTIVMDYNRTELAPCCTATRMSNISMVYKEKVGNTNTTVLRKETLPNMVIESCGCM
jgi:TGF-beta receptor